MQGWKQSNSNWIAHKVSFDAHLILWSYSLKHSHCSSWEPSERECCNPKHRCDPNITAGMYTCRRRTNRPSSLCFKLLAVRNVGKAGQGPFAADTIEQSKSWISSVVWGKWQHKRGRDWPAGKYPSGKPRRPNHQWRVLRTPDRSRQTPWWHGNFSSLNTNYVTDRAVETHAEREFRVHRYAAWRGRGTIQCKWCPLRNSKVISQIASAALT